jgi:putative hemolysin
MPKPFDMCRKQGGKIKTKEMKDGKYMHVCILNGKSYASEVKSKSECKDESKGNSMIADAIKLKGMK